MMVIEFTQDDSAYLEWIEKNPSGYVLNSRRMADPAYMVLHKATCPHISISRSSGGYTEKEYIKICSGASNDLLEWGKQQGCRSGVSKKCLICKP
jgi:hypothetical protein